MILSLSTNEIFKANPALQTMVANNIKKDYVKGIRSARATDFITTIMDVNQDGEWVYDWLKGEYPKLGDTIILQGSDYWWRLVGIRFKYDGQPLIERTYQQLNVGQ